MSHQHVLLHTENGPVQAVAPVILSASRVTDIPAFHGQWFMQRLRAGYAMRHNPITAQQHWISFQRLGAMVFWTKNPAPLLPLLDEIKSCCPDFYFLFSLNDYEAEGWEPGLPPLAQRIKTFCQLAQRIGPERVVWRFDPICLADAMLSMDTIIARMQALAAALHQSTRRMIFSFVQIRPYKSVSRHIQAEQSPMREPTRHEQEHFFAAVNSLGKKYGLACMHCAPPAQRPFPGIQKGCCIDPDLLSQICSPENITLRQHLGLQPRLPGLPALNALKKKRLPKDTHQRTECGCVESRDIGEYNTCSHGCLYCYATHNAGKVTRNMARLHMTIQKGKTPPSLII